MLKTGPVEKAGEYVPPEGTPQHDASWSTSPRRAPYFCGLIQESPNSCLFRANCYSLQGFLILSHGSSCLTSTLRVSVPPNNRVRSQHSSQHVNKSDVSMHLTSIRRSFGTSLRDGRRHHDIVPISFAPPHDVSVVRASLFSPTSYPPGHR